MQWIDLTLPTPAENLALDEAWLELAERGELGGDLLRVWEPQQPCVVVGRASRVDDEVDRAACRSLNIPVLRRSSGGAAVVALPGCLMYALVLHHPHGAAVPDLEAVHRQTLTRMAQALADAGCPAHRQGTSDLAWDDRKVSGNSLRCKRRAVLYHGTLLYQADLSLISRCLRRPPRQPEYRRDRSHADFVANLPLDRASLVDAVVRAWQAETVVADWPRQLVRELVEAKFSRDTWNFER